MSVTGPAGPSLTARLQEKLRQDREQIETLTRSELRRLAESLSASSRDALDAMESSTRERMARMRSEMEEIARRQRRWPLWTALACATLAGALFALLWMATSWARSDLRGLLEQTSSARATLRALEAETGGVRIATLASGETVMRLPGGSETLFRCGREAEGICVTLVPATEESGSTGAPSSAPSPRPRPGTE